MNWINKTILFIILLMSLLCALTSCKQSPYEQKLKEELASGERHDSLFLGLYLGMPKKDFYTHCWELHKQGLITNGSTNVSVRWDLEDQKADLVADFYPNFYENEIYEMPVYFKFKNYAPWIKKYSLDTLLNASQTIIKDWYDIDEFIPLKREIGIDSLTLYADIQGNRRIIIHPERENMVEVLISDMSRKEQGDKAFREKAKKLKGYRSHGN